MTDSLYPDPFDKHVEIFDLLMSDPQWTTGQMCSWSRNTVECMDPGDNSYCGVLMLACIKFFARRFTRRFSVEKIPNARNNLLLDDVQCDVNELRESLESLVPSPRTSTRNQ